MTEQDETSPAGIDQRISFITLVVGDLAATRRFYVEGLGWRPELEASGEVVMIRVGEQLMLSLWAREHAENEIGALQTGGTPPITLAHNVGSGAEVDGVLRHASAAGATVLPAEHRDWGGYSGYFVDPDGFRWEVAHLPGPLGDSLVSAPRQMHQVDFRGARLVECDLRGVRITGSEVDDLHIDAFAGDLGEVYVEGVAVSDFVRAELDRRFPERVALRELSTPEDFRLLWDRLEDRWLMLIHRAEGAPYEARFTGVNGEWSIAQTLRHLVCAIDIWVGRMVLGGGIEAFHPLGLPPDDYPADEAAQLGLDPAAEPSWADILAAYADRRTLVRSVLAGQSGLTLAEQRTGVPAPLWEEVSRPVSRCLRVVLNEHLQHLRYAERDLDLVDPVGDVAE